MTRNPYRRAAATFLLLFSFPVLSHGETPPDSTGKISIWSRMFRGNIDRTFDKKFDISFLAAPSYTREASVGVGGMVSGLYRTDRTDRSMPPSNVNVSANFSLNGFMAVSLRGNNYFPGNRSRLSYEIKANSQNRDLWGISYDATSSNPKSDYNRRQILFNTDYVYRAAGNFYVGGALDYVYSQARKLGDATYLGGQKRVYSVAGLGVSLQYDTRDFIPNPSRGFNVLLRQMIYPEAFGNGGKLLWQTTFNANYYQPVWKGGLLAFDVFGRFNTNDSPWPMREELGGMYRMRGYYQGRYIDNNIATAQVELRQHIWRRIGAAAWAGGGTVSPTLKEFKTSDILPTYGVGLRWEFKHNVNIRLDYGFGKKTSGFVINVAEAF